MTTTSTKIQLTPGKPGYQPVEMQIAVDMLRPLFFKQTGIHSHTGLYGIEYNSKKVILGYALAVSDVHSVSQLPNDYYNNSAPRLYQEYMSNLELAFLDKDGDKIAEEMAQYFYNYELEFGGFYPESTWDVPSLDNKVLRDYSNDDKLSALYFFSAQEIPFEEYPNSNTNNFLKLVDALTILSSITSITRTFFSKSFYTGLNNLKLKDYLEKNKLKKPFFRPPQKLPDGRIGYLAGFPDQWKVTHEFLKKHKDYNKFVDMEKTAKEKYSQFNKEVQKGTHPKDAAKTIGDSHYEKLQGSQYSIRLSQKDRVVFDQHDTEKVIDIRQVGGHYKT